MDKGKWLNRGWKINCEIEQLIRAKEKSFELACRVNSDRSGERVQESKKNTSEDKNLTYAEYSRLLDSKIDDLYKIKMEIQEAINQVDNSIYRALLTARYINFKSWEQIAVDLHYSYYHVVKHLRVKAIRSIMPQNTTGESDIMVL